MKFLFPFSVFLCALLFSPAPTEAQFTGPSAVNSQMTAAEVLQNARRLHLRDTQVQLRGFVVEHIREDYYWFRDDSGRIRIEIYPEVMPSQPFDDTTEIVLIGEVDFNLLFGTYIWVKRLEIAEDVDTSGPSGTLP